MTNKIRNVTKQLLGAEDVLFGRGTVNQRRGTADVAVHRLDLALPVADEAELAITDPNEYPKASIGSRNFVAVNGQYQEVSTIQPVLFSVGAMMSAEYPYAIDGDTVAKWTGEFPKTLTLADEGFTGPGWQVTSTGLGRAIISETAPSASFTREGVRWYKPSESTTYVYYCDGDSCQWVQEPVQSAEGTLRDELAAPDSAVLVGGAAAASVGSLVGGIGDPTQGGRLVALPKYLTSERRSENINWLELARPKNQPPINTLNNIGDAYIVFVGDSHTAGQGATGVAGNINEVPQMPPPSGVTDGFHKRDTAYGNFTDLIAKDLRDKSYIGLRNRPIATTESTFYNLYTGSWSQGTDPSADVFGVTTWASAAVIGDNVIKRGAPDFPRDWFEITYRKYTLGAIIKFEFREVTQGGTANLTRLKYANWTLPSAIPNCSRTDGAGDIDRTDTYSAVSSYNNFVRFKLPYVGNWECRITIESAGNAGAGGTGLYIQAHELEECQFLNAGRGNHTILDYLGEPVTVGAGGSGDLDHTDHLAEVLAYNPTMIILEPMIINDWFHGVSLQDTFSAFDEMLRRIKEANCDVIVLGPAPVITDAFPFDWSQNPSSATQPPLADNLKGKGTYLQYYRVIERVAGIHGVRFINTYWHYLYRFYKDDHSNWTLGDLAGRIHVNAVGHDIYRDAFVRHGGLLDAIID